MEFKLAFYEAVKLEFAYFYDVVILGGLAGLTVAIYIARARLTTLIIDKKEFDGKATAKNVIESYPGFPEVINRHDG